jgi:hypothetical protein
MIYLASPYTHENKSKQLERAMNAMIATGKLLELGINAYSPTVHWCVYGQSSDKAGYDHFRVHDEEMILLCERFVILELEGWQDSEGVTKEMIFAYNNRKLIESANFYDLALGRFRPQIVGSWFYKEKTNGTSEK